MNLVFFGASRFGLRCLELTATLSDINVVGVLTAPRSFKISYSKDKQVTNVLHADFHSTCKKLYVPIIELMGKLSDLELIKAVQKWSPDFILVVGWYHMVPRSMLKIPPKGVAGMHASLLPHYRGGAPLIWAMINGEKEVGISLFYFDDGVDTGDIVGQRSITVRFNDTIASVYGRIEEAGLDLLAEMLPRIANNTAKRKQQEQLPFGQRPLWPQRSPEDGLINWSLPAIDIYNFIRAQTQPYPGAFTLWKGKHLIIWESKIFDWTPRQGLPGEVLAVINEGPLQGVLVATLDGDCPLLLTKVQVGHSPLTGAVFAMQYGITRGEVLGDRERVETEK